MKRFLMFAGFALALFACAPAHAQVYDTTCPAGSSVAPGGTARNPTNDHLKQNYCIDGTGTPVLNFALPVSNNRAIYLTDAKYNLPATGYTSCNVTTANGSNVFQTDTADPPFTASMVGWIIALNSEACQTYTNSGVNRFPTTSTTITGFIDAHHVTVSSNANGVCTAGCDGGWFPSDSQPAFQSAWNDALATGVCANLIGPAGYYAIGSAVVNTVNPAPCGLERVFGVQSNDQSAGFIGQGPFATRIVFLPSFDGATCAAEISGTVCLFGSKQQVGPTFRDFTVDGLGFNNPANMSGKILLQANYQADIENIQILNWAGSSSANTTALQIAGAANAPATVRNFQCYAGGYNCVSATHQIAIFGSASVNLGTGLTVSISDFSTGTGNSWYVHGVGSTCAANITGVFTSTGDFLYNGVGGNQRGALCPQAGSVITLVGDTLTGGTFSSTKGGAIVWNATAATVKASGTTFSCTGAGCLFSNAGSGSAFYDMCGNNFNGNTATLTNLAVYGSCSITGSAFTTGSVALTSGWGTSSLASAGGDSHYFNFVITGAAGSAAPVATITFPVTYIQAPTSCAVSQTSGTFGVLTAPAIGSLSTTGFTITFAGTPGANTYGFSGHCGP